MSLTDAADELYGTDPSTFVARRTELVKQARAAGDKALASQVGALRRPTVSAWYLNLLGRSGASELDELIELGQTMREAQSRLDMAAVTSLGPERQRRETAVLRRLELLLTERGITPSPAAWGEVARTLTAVVADGSAAAAVRSGCLARGLVYAGFGDVDLSGALGAELEAWADRRAAVQAGTPEAPPEEATEPAPTVRAVPDPRRERLVAEARAGVTLAVEERQAAEREVEELGLAYAAAQERLRAAEEAVSEAQSALDRATEDHGDD